MLNEFELLLDLEEEEIVKISSFEIAESIMRVRQGKVKLEGGYDGLFGKIHIYSDEEKNKNLKKFKQKSVKPK